MFDRLVIELLLHFLFFQRGGGGDVVSEAKFQPPFEKTFSNNPEFELRTAQIYS